MTRAREVSKLITATGDVGIADKIVHTGDTNTAIRFSSNDTFTVETAGSERLRITSAGNIGINQTSPKTKLDINGTIISTPVAYSSNQDQPYLIAGTSGYTGATTNWNTFGIQHRIKTDSNGVPRVTIDGPNGQMFCVTHPGNVSIGTISPSTILHIAGTTPIFTIEDTSGANTNTSRSCLLRHNDQFQHQLRTSTGIYQATAYAMVTDGAGTVSHNWQTGVNSSRLFVNATGVGINQLNPEQKLHVVGNVQINGGVLTSLLTSVIADDAYEDVVMPVKGGIIVITSFTTYDTYSQPNGTGLIYYDAGDSKNASVLVDASNTLSTSIDASTTAGTFTDGRTTIAMINAGTIRIWNRMNTNRRYKITLL